MPRRTDGPIRSEDRPVSGGLERLQKVLAQAGIGSRRACEELIVQGRVSIDGKVAKTLGTKVDLTRQKVTLDGELIRPEPLVYFAVNKPKGYVSTNNDPSGRPRVVDLLPEIPQRVYTVGRLDEDSVGLILLTNDGELANKLSHPKFGVEKVYRVLVAGHPTPEELDQLVQGVWLSDGKARAREVHIVGKKGEATLLDMVLAEGKNREVRRMLAKLGHKVMSLTRLTVGPVALRGLEAGQWRTLTMQEVAGLREVAAGRAPKASTRTAPTPRKSAAAAGRPERPPVNRITGPRALTGPKRPAGPSGIAGPRVSGAPSKPPARGPIARRDAAPRGGRPAKETLPAIPGDDETMIEVNPLDLPPEPAPGPRTSAITGPRASRGGASRPAASSAGPRPKRAPAGPAGPRARRPTGPGTGLGRPRAAQGGPKRRSVGPEGPVAGGGEGAGSMGGARKRIVGPKRPRPKPLRPKRKKPEGE